MINRTTTFFPLSFQGVTVEFIGRKHLPLIDQFTAL